MAYLNTVDMNQQTVADGCTVLTIGDLGREPIYEPTHAWVDFPSAPRKDPAGAALNSSDGDGDPEYASAWNFAEFVQQSQSAKDEVKQTTVIEQIDTTILLEDQP